MEADLGLDLWPGPDHWDGLHFVGFNVGISFIITECYANVASNHPSIKIAALRSPDQNSRAFRVSPLLWLHSVSKVNVSSSRPPPPQLTPWPGFLPDSTPPPPHCLICCSLLTGSLPLTTFSLGTRLLLFPAGPGPKLWGSVSGGEILHIRCKLWSPPGTAAVRACRPYQYVC